MIKKFRAKLKENGQSLKWFFDKYLADKCSYVYLSRQLNGYDPVQPIVRESIYDYMRKYRD